MRVLFALAVGYAIGAKGGGKDFDQLMRSLKAVRDSEEFGDLVAAARSHVGHALHEFATMVDGSAAALDDGQELVGSDLVDQVRHLFTRD